jgi:hypothetical protein
LSFALITAYISIGAFGTLAPFTIFQGAVNATPAATYFEAANNRNEIGIAYIYLAEAD